MLRFCFSSTLLGLLNGLLCCFHEFYVCLHSVFSKLKGNLISFYLQQALGTHFYTEVIIIFSSILAQFATGQKGQIFRLTQYHFRHASSNNCHKVSPRSPFFRTWSSFVARSRRNKGNFSLKLYSTEINWNTNSY